MKKINEYLAQIPYPSGWKKTELKNIHCNYNNDYYGDRACKAQ